jgi:hypothetical protein
MTAALPGTWNLQISTPIGTLHADLVFEEKDGTLFGVARGKDEEVPLRDIVVAGDRVTWSQSITRPLRLNLDFDVVVDGDAMTGSSRAGRLPKSRVAGARVGGLS